MPTRAATIRFTDDLWEVLEREAARQGTSAAQVVRDATLIRLASLMAREGDEETLAKLASIAGRTGTGSAKRPVGDGEPSLPADVTLPSPDERRVAALRRAGLLGRTPQPAFDRLARIAAQVLNAPVALVSLVSGGEHTFKSCVGLPEKWADRGTLPTTHSFCVHTVAIERPLIVGDAREHPVLAGNPAIDELDAIAYAGVPLITADGLVIGTLCVLDSQPRVWTRDQVALLSDLAAAVVSEIEARRRGAGEDAPLADASP